MRVRVRDAESDEDLDEVRRLFREFVVWHRARQAQNAGSARGVLRRRRVAGRARRTSRATYAATEGGALLLATQDGAAVGLRGTAPAR